MWHGLDESVFCGLQSSLLVVSIIAAVIGFRACPSSQAWWGPTRKQKRKHKHKGKCGFLKREHHIQGNHKRPVKYLSAAKFQPRPRRQKRSASTGSSSYIMTRSVFRPTELADCTDALRGSSPEAHRLAVLLLSTSTFLERLLFKSVLFASPKSTCHFAPFAGCPREISTCALRDCSHSQLAHLNASSVGPV